MLEGIVRESIDKKSTKALRRDGYLIANIYGKGLENINAAFNVNEFVKELRAKNTLAFDVKVGEKTLKVVVVDYQKHPVTNELKHVDLKVVLDGVESKYLIPVKISGTPIGLKNKGVLVIYRRKLAVRCIGENLPNSFDLDVSNLDVDNNILVKDVKVPDGVTMLEGANIAIVGVTTAN